MDPFASDKTAVDTKLELPPIPKREPVLKAIQHNYTPWGDFTNSPFPQEDRLGKAYGKVASRVLFGEDSENTNLMTGLVPGADVAIKLSEGKQPGLLDGFGDLKPLAAMLPVLKWGKELPSPKTRIGKSQRNLDKYAGEKTTSPTVTRFHRTTNDAADKILDEGLRLNNENFGRFTGDADEIPPMIWLSNNPDRIPVMNSVYNIPGGPRMAPDVSTLKVEIPQEDYDQLKRFTQVPGPNGRRFVEVKPGEQSLFDDYSTGRMHGRTKTDLIGEDVSPDYISLLPKPEPGRLINRLTNRDWSKLLIDELGDNLKSYGQLPRELRDKVRNKTLTYDDAEEIYNLLPSLHKFEVGGTFPGTDIPRIIHVNTSDKPRRSKSYHLEPGPIARGSNYIRNGILETTSRGVQHFPTPREVMYFGDNIPQYDAGKYARSVNRVKKLAEPGYSRPSTNVSVGAIGRGSYNLGPMSTNQLEYLIRNSDDKQLRRLIDETIDPFDPPDEDDIIAAMWNIRNNDGYLKEFVQGLINSDYGIPSSFLPDFAEDVFASKGKTMPGMFKNKESPDEVNIDPSQLTWMPLDD